MIVERELALLRSVAEQLRQPLTVIARQAELLGMAETQEPAALAAVMGSEARAALTLVDTYLLGLQLLHDQVTLALEPVSLSSTLHDVVQSLYGFAKQYGVELDLVIAGRYGPVIAHRQALSALFANLGLTFVEAASTLQAPDRHLTLAVHQGRQGVVAGVYGALPLSALEWRRALALGGAVPTQAEGTNKNDVGRGRGGVRQVLPGVLSGNGASLLVAHSLGRAMDAEVRTGRYARQTGLAVQLMPSRQLQFV